MHMKNMSSLIIYFCIFCRAIWHKVLRNLSVTDANENH